MSERQKRKIAQKEANKRLKKRMIDKTYNNPRASKGAFNLNFLVDGWLELESDPGTFSLLIEDFGCHGAQVEEIYDLEQKFEKPILGFIFLFKWLNNHQNDRSRNQKSATNYASSNGNDREQPPEQRQWSYVEDENIISEIFFAKQMISNSCATHALISILLNCDYDELQLGPTLSRLKEHTKIMDPENKGYAIGNLPELAKAHNSHASYSSLYNRNKMHSQSSGMSYMISGNQRTNLQQQNQHEAYHFVSYVPIKNRLYELDGLKNYPIDHGPFGPKEDWTEKFRAVIKQRLMANKSGDDSTISNDIRYNLMAVVPDKRACFKAELKRLKQYQKIVQDSIKRLTTPLSIDVDIPNPPYSPLSNATLSADETSANNSPTGHHEAFFSDEEMKADKYFIVKFNKNSEATNTREENLESAHQNCITNIEVTTVSPVDLTVNIQESNGDMLKEETNKVNTNSTNNCKIEVTKEVESEESEKVKEEPKNLPTATKQHLLKDNQINGSVVTESHLEINETPAHKGEKYNLSGEPPFDFNIMDEMQHVHFGKSTLKDLRCLTKKLHDQTVKLESILKEENEKRRKYKIDNSRRTHNYEPFIMTFLSLLAKQGNLADLIEKDLGLTTTDEPQVATASSTTTIAPTIQPPSKAPKPTSEPIANKPNGQNGRFKNKVKANPTQKPKYKYVSTGRPVGRPRKNPLVPPPVKGSSTK